MSILELKNVSFCYNKGGQNEIEAIKDLSLSIKEGEFVALVGHNGSGKSTVARLLNGLLVPTAGSVEVCGILTTDKKRLFQLRSNLGVVFQNPDNQMVATIIEDDVAFGPENLGLPSDEIRKRVDWALECVGMAEHKSGTPYRLSGGQKQRVAIAGALAIKPKIMVLDEATSMLDPIGRAEVLDIITRLNKEEKMTVIMITHFMDEAALADRIVVMKNGEVLTAGGSEVFCKEELIIDAGLELPLPAQFARALRGKGVDLPKGLTTSKLLVDKLALVD